MVFEITQQQTNCGFDSRLVLVDVDGHHFHVHEFFLIQTLKYYKPGSCFVSIAIGDNSKVHRNTARKIIDIIYYGILHENNKVIFDCKDSMYYYQFVTGHTNIKCEYWRFVEHSEKRSLIRQFIDFIEDVDYVSYDIRHVINKIFNDFGKLKGGEYTGMRVPVNHDDSKESISGEYVFSVDPVSLSTKLMLKIFEHEGYNIRDKFLEEIGVTEEMYRAYKFELPGCSYEKKRVERIKRANEEEFNDLD